MSAPSSLPRASGPTTPAGCDFRRPLTGVDSRSSGMAPAPPSLACTSWASTFSASASPPPSSVRERTRRFWPRSYRPPSHAGRDMGPRCRVRCRLGDRRLALERPPSDLDNFFLPAVRIVLSGHPLLIYTVRYQGIIANDNGPLGLVPLTAVS